MYKGLLVFFGAVGEKVVSTRVGLDHAKKRYLTAKRLANQLRLHFLPDLEPLNGRHPTT
jgi:hypothetical protein